MWLQILVVDGKRVLLIQDEKVYLVIRAFLRHTGLDITHEGVNEATALSHCLPLLLLATAQVPTHISIIHLNPIGNTYMSTL